MKTASQLAPRGTSVYEHLRERLRAEVITPGKPGEKVPGEKTLATLFGVSPVTMSRALQELQSEGVILRVPGKGTFLAETAQVSHEARDINAGFQAPEEPWSTVIAPDTILPPVRVSAAIIANLGVDDGELRYGNWEPRIVSRLEKLIQSGGGTTITINRDMVPFGEDVVTVKSLRERGVNSVFLIPDVDLPGEHYLADLQRWQLADPTVVLTGFSLGSRDKASIDGLRFDDIYGTLLIGRHLQELGHRHIAYVVPNELIYNVVSNEPENFAPQRLKALRAALEENEGASVEEIRVSMPPEGQRSKENLQLPMSEYDIWFSYGEHAARTLDLEKRFSALVFVNDNMARGYMLACREMKRRISASIVGYDDRTFASGLGLTTVHPPIEEMADYAFRMACSRLRQPFEAGRLDVTLKPMLIRRSSTRSAANQDAE